MIKVKLVVIVGFLLAFVAGVVGGIVGSRRWLPPANATIPSTQSPTTRRVNIMDELKLTQDQQDKWRKVHEAAFKEMNRERDERRTVLRQQRDEAVLALMGGQHKSEYDKIMADYVAAATQSDRERFKAFEKMQEQLRPQLQTFLTSEQWTKYEEIQARMREEHRRREMNRRGEQNATTRPATTLPSH